MSIFEESIISGLNVLDIAKDHDIPSLKKRGSSYIMLCPTAHKEKTPSCYIRDKKNFFYCYGCHAQGGPYTLLAFLNDNPLSYLEVKIGFNFRDEKFVEALRQAILNEKIKYGFADEAYRNYFNANL